MPVIGVDPVYVVVIMVITAAGIVLAANKGFGGNISGTPHIVIAGIEAAMIVLGAFMLYIAVFKAKIEASITNNKLSTEGIYSWVRNPIYTAFLFICTGAILISGNNYLLVLPPLYWLYMTILMKHTEEKWLENLHGIEYLEYKKACKQMHIFSI